MLSFTGTWEQFVIRDGLPDMRIECLFQDSGGVLWVGTHARGVVTYSGEGFHNYTKRDGLSGNGVYGIAEALDGSIWLATDGGLSRGGGGKFRPVEETVGTSFLWGSASDPTGAMWFVLQRDSEEPPRVCRSDGTTVRVFTVDTDSSCLGHGVNCIAVDDNGVVWCGGDGIYRLVGGAFRRVAGDRSEAREIKALCASESDSVVFASLSGVFEIHGDSLERVPGLGGNVESIVRTASGALWMATREGHLIEVGRPGGCRKIGSCGVPLWRASTVDNIGRVWLGTYGFGLFCYDESRITIADSSSGLPADDVQGVTTVANRVWAATSKGLVAVDGEMVPGLVEGSNDYRIAEVTEILTDRGGRLWIGKRNGAVYVLDDDVLVQCEKAEPLRRHRIDSMVEDESGSVWVASSFGGGVAQYRSAHALVCHTAVSDATIPARVGAMAIGPEGTVFLGSADSQDGLGVVEYDGRSFQKVEGIAMNAISAMCFDHEGRMWLGSEEGLTVYDHDYVISYGIEDGLSSELIASLFCDRLGRLWIGTEGGGVCVHDGKVFQTMDFDRPLCNTVNDIWEDEMGIIWLATNGGLVKRVLQSTEVTAEVIELVADHGYPNPVEVQIPDTVSRLTFSLLGASRMERPGNLVFRFKLEGHESDWRQTRDTEVSYPKLEAGDYRFLVEAVDRDLNYSPQVSVILTVVADPRIDALNQALRAEGAQGELIGESRAMSELMQQITEVAWTDLTVLVLGETGTGKGLAARKIHDLSERRDKPFIHVNCGAVQESLIDSELFGHERGAFTGAFSKRLGKFELAHGGTILLDEIGDLPLESQSRLLTVLQERTIERVGGTQTLTVDVRVIAATNRDLSEAVRTKSYRADLFYRLNVFPIRVPPLRDRMEDAPRLAAHFVSVFASHLSQPEPVLTPEALKVIASHDWPGNVRELEHTMQRAVIRCRGGFITPRELGLADELRPMEPATEAQILPMEEFERQYFKRVLEHTGGVIHGNRGAAKLLEMKPTTLRSRLEKLGIRKRRKKGTS